MPVIEGGGSAAPANPGRGFGTGLSGRPAGTPTSAQMPKKKAPAKKSAPKPGAAAGAAAGRVVSDQAAGKNMAGVNEMVAARIQAMIAAAPGRITINSGFRTNAQQQKLYNDYRAGRGNLAAKPGSSNHEHGFACDLGYADDRTRKWVQANAARFGLHFPVRGESWHAEPVESRGIALSAQAKQAGFQPIDFVNIKKSGLGVTAGQAAYNQNRPARVAGGTQGPVTVPPEGSAAAGFAPMGAGGAMGAVPAGAAGAGSMVTSTGPDVFGPDGKIDPVKALQTYGFVYELANSVPELKTLMSKAITEQWSADRFTAAVQTTKWWKSTNNNQRQILELQKTNPGEYKRLRQQTIDKMVIMARNLGVKEGNQRIFILAERALSLGWSDDEISRFLAADIKVQDKGNTGAVAVTVDSLKEQAEQYGVPLSKATLQTWTTQILRGMVPEASFESYLKEQAKSLFPGLAGAIDAGITVAQYTAPYRELTAEILELNPADIRMNDKHLQKALYAVGPDGKRTQMTLSEYQEYLRGTEGYTKTRQASESAASFVNTVTDLFGKTA